MLWPFPLSYSLLLFCTFTSTYSGGPLFLDSFPMSTTFFHLPLAKFCVPQSLICKSFYILITFFPDPTLPSLELLTLSLHSTHSLGITYVCVSLQPVTHCSRTISKPRLFPQEIRPGSQSLLGDLHESRLPALLCSGGHKREEL